MVNFLNGCLSPKDETRCKSWDGMISEMSTHNHHKHKNIYRRPHKNSNRFRSEI